MYIIRDTTGQVHYVNSLEDAAQIVELDPNEIAWALEEHGRCETDAHCVVVDEEASDEHDDTGQRVLQA